MKRPVENITLAQYRALTAKKPRKAQGVREGATGLSTMLKEGWHWTHQPGMGYRLDKDGLTSGWQPDEKSAVAHARRAALRAGDDQ